MPFDEVKNNTKDVKEKFRFYIDKNVDYIKLKAFKILMKSSFLIIKSLIIIVLFMFAVLFASIALAVLLSIYLKSYILGFFIVSILFVIVTFLFLYFSKKYLETTLLVKFSKIFFND